MKGTCFEISSIRRVSISDADRIPTVFEKARQAVGFICPGTSTSRAEDPLRAGKGTMPARLDGVGRLSEKQMNVSSEAKEEAAVSPGAAGSSWEIVSSKSKGIPLCSDINTIHDMVGLQADLNFPGPENEGSFRITLSDPDSRKIELKVLSHLKQVVNQTA